MEPAQSHDSSLRFIKAGLYEDAIHSLLEGTKVLNSTLAHYGVSPQQESSPQYINKNLETIQSKVLKDDDETDQIVVDTTPLEYTRCDSASCPIGLDLLLTMKYNLGLAYHLYALSQNDPNLFRAGLYAALKFYHEVERQFGIHGIPAPSGLQNNIKHVYHSLLAGHQKRPSIPTGVFSLSSNGGNSSPNTIVNEVLDISYSYRC